MDFFSQFALRILLTQQITIIQRKYRIRKFLDIYQKADKLKTKNDFENFKELISRLDNPTQQKLVYHLIHQSVDNQGNKWRRKLTEKEINRIKGTKNKEQLETVLEQLAKATAWNIYNFDGVEHFIGWPVFLIGVGLFFYRLRKTKKEDIF